jgi:DNA adenine methylase
MWAGGKTRLIKKYRKGKVLPDTFSSYIEPFMGAGAMFIWAYGKNPNASFVVNDINPGIMNIYRAIKDDLVIFLKFMDRFSEVYLALPKGETDKPFEKKHDKDWKKLYAIRPCRRYYYYKLRDEHAFEYEGWSKTLEAANLYFLMKTGFNGLWQENKNTNNRFGTPAGLLNQKKEAYNEQNVREWNKALQNCKLMTGDFKATLKEIKSDSFVFLDPPYRGCFTQYGVDFDDDLQRSVVGYLNSATDIGAYALMSNRDVGDNFFENIAGSNEIVYFNVTYTAGRRKQNDDGTFSAKKAREILMIGKGEING